MGIRRQTALEMIRYSAPLIPNMLFWWITNSSDKFVVGYMIGASASGLINVAYKILIARFTAAPTAMVPMESILFFSTV